MTETDVPLTRQSWLRSRFGAPDLTGRSGVLAAVGVDTLGLGLFLPLSLLYFTFTTDIPVPAIGAALTAATVIALPSGAIGGTLVDRFGPRAIMVGNNLLAACGFTLYIVASEPWQIFGGALLIGIGDRTYWSCWPPYVTRISGTHGFHRWFAFLEAVKAACMALGALIAGVMLAIAPGAGMARAIVALNVISSVAAAVLFARQRGITASIERSAPGDRALKPTWLSLLRQARYVMPLLAQSLVAPTWLLVSVALPVYYVFTWGLGEWLPPVLFAIGNLLVFVAQTPAAHALRRWRKDRIVLLAAAIVCVAMVMLLAIGAWTARPTGMAYATALLVGMLLATAFLLYIPAAYAISMEAADAASRGRAASMFDVGTALTAAAGPATMSLLVVSHPSLLWLGAAAGVLAGAAFFIVNARWAGSRAGSPVAATVEH